MNNTRWNLPDGVTDYDTEPRDTEQPTDAEIAGLHDDAAARLIGLNMALEDIEWCLDMRWSSAAHYEWLLEAPKHEILEWIDYTINE